MKKVAIATLGCKTNQFESASMIEQLMNSGYTIVPFTEMADIYVVNSCTVTAKTDAETRRLIRRARRLNPDARIVATGCYAQVAPGELEKMPEVDAVLGNMEKSAITDLIELGKNTVSDIGNESTAKALKLETFAEHTRAFLQIQNGCNAFCSYCIVPYARGRSRSVATDDVIEGVRTLAANGYKEIVLTGIHLGGYGVEISPPTSLTSLVQEIDHQTIVQRLRIGSIEPNEVTNELLNSMKESDHICHHLHLPLQSGSNTVLQRMGRHYRADQFKELVIRCKQILPDAFIGADVIAGFPGETEEEFAQTWELIRAVPLSDLHVFPYSRRTGTKAATMDNQVPDAVVTERARKLRELAMEKKQIFLDANIGKELQVLVQSCEDGICHGLSRNYISVKFKGDMGMTNTEQTVVATSRNKNTLLA